MIIGVVWSKPVFGGLHVSFSPFFLVSYELAVFIVLLTLIYFHSDKDNLKSDWYMIQYCCHFLAPYMLLA